MLLFRSEEDIDRWSAQNNLPRGATFSLEQAWKLARAWYYDRLRPGWRRKSLDEAEALFAEIGLHGPFWNLRS